MLFAVAIAWTLLHAEHVIRERLRGEPVEHVLARTCDVVDRPARGSRKIPESLHLHVAVFGRRRLQPCNGDVVSRDIQQQHVNRDAGKRSGADDVV